MTMSGMRSRVFEIAIRTSEGKFLAKYSAAGLCGLDFPKGAVGARGDETSAELPAEIRAWHETTIKALDDALAGRTPKALPPLDLTSGTAFQRNVWKTLRKIGMGETRSYADVAKAIGKPTALR